MNLRHPPARGLVALGLFALGGPAPNAFARHAPMKPAAVAKAGPGTAPAPAKGPAPDATKPGAAPVPGKPASFEDAKKDALPAGDLANLFEPLFATCGDKADFARRQCEQIKSWSLARLRSHRWDTIADDSALQVAPYDASEKSLTVTVTGCLSCQKPPVIAGAPRLVATAAPKAFEEGAPVGLDLGLHEIPQPDAQKATRWVAKVRPKLRVEFVFNAGQPFDAKVGKGVAIVPVGYRVFNVCSGEVLASDPPSKEPVKLAGKRDPICPAENALSDEELEAQKEQAGLPDSLSRSDVEKSMAPVQQRVYECGEEFELKQGVARVHVALTGDGKHTINILPPFDKGDVHLCIRSALNDAKFPRFKSTSPPVNVDYPFVLRR